MNTVALSRNKSIHAMLILSIICSFFVMPMPAKAGMLSDIWSTITPVMKIAGRVGGAIAGATMASAFVPPLGMIAGGVAGWLVGGAITDYATGSLCNLAIVAGGAAGALALGPSALGIVGGFLIGGAIGKIAMTLLKWADNSVTGGVLLNQGPSSSGNTALTPSSEIGAIKTEINSTTNKAVNTVMDKLDGISDKANDTKDNLIRAAQEKYEQASKAYREAAEKAENSTVVIKAKQAMDTAKQALQQLLRK